MYLCVHNYATDQQFKTPENDWATHFKTKKTAVRLKAKAAKKLVQSEAFWKRPVGREGGSDR